MEENMYHRWEIDEKDLIRIKEVVDGLLDDIAPDRLAVEFIFRDCHDVHMEDFYYWIGWVIFQRTGIAYIELKWGSRGFYFDRIGTEIKEMWKLDISDYRQVRIFTKTVDQVVELVFGHDGEEVPVMSCPLKYYDPPDPGALISYERRQREYLKDAEARLMRVLERIQG